MNLFKKNGGRILAFLMATALIFIFGACGEDGDPDNGIDYKSYDTDYAILVRNESSQKLVAFKGDLKSNLILGGIPVGNNHALKRNPELFTKNEDFAMILLTEEQYLANKGNLSAVEQTPFTRVYVFYNHTGENTNHYVISKRVGGDYKLTIQNATPYNVELRLGGIGGETIGYATKDMLNTILYVGEGDFNIFPVFKKYNALRDTVETLYPKLATGYAWFMPIGFEDTPTGRAQTFNVGLATASLNTATSGVAWLAINNQTNPPIAIHLVQGLNVVRTTAGVSYFTQTKTFQIDMVKTTIGTQTTFGSELQISGYKVGPDAFEVDIEDSEGNKNHTLLVDMMYTVNVTGSHLNNPIDLKAVITGTPTKVTDF